MGFIQEFKDFAMKGNVVDMAVGVVIGGAFGKIVKSLVDNIITPLLGTISGGKTLDTLSTSLSKTDEAANELMYGSFIQSVIDFLIIAMAIFVAIKIMNRVREQFEGPTEEPAPAAPPEDIQLLREIRDALKKE
ncbi:large-conductance mechanosensitive channel protein MscL [Planctomycetota bacterium]